MPESVTPFISREDLSEYLGRDVENDPGALIAVDAACDVCRTFTEQTINAGSSTHVFDGTGTDALLLRELPVTSVTSVAVSDGMSPPSLTTAGTFDFVLNGRGILYARDSAGTSSFGNCWPRGRQNIRVSYSHGYTTGSVDSNLPRDLRMVALTVASRLLIQGPTLFETIGEVSTRYAAESTALMPTERAILRRYRRRGGG